MEQPVFDATNLAQLEKPSRIRTALIAVGSASAMVASCVVGWFLHAGFAATQDHDTSVIDTAENTQTKEIAPVKETGTTTTDTTIDPAVEAAIKASQETTKLALELTESFNRGAEVRELVAVMLTLNAVGQESIARLSRRGDGWTVQETLDSALAEGVDKNDVVGRLMPLVAGGPKDVDRMMATQRKAMGLNSVTIDKEGRWTASQEDLKKARAAAAARAEKTRKLILTFD